MIIVSLSITNLFKVNVPVLSEQRIVTAASSSIAVIRVTIAFCSDNCLAPMASVTDNTVGLEKIQKKIFLKFYMSMNIYIAIGIPPMSKTNILSIPRR